MKRGDPVTNRFIDYCIMQAGTLQILVRDGKTKQILYAPTEKNARWIHRVKSGLGRASKNEFEVTLAVGSELLRTLDRLRDWRFSFDAHYEIYIWDFPPGQTPMDLFHSMIDVSQRTSCRTARLETDGYRCSEEPEECGSSEICTATRNMSSNS